MSLPTWPLHVFLIELKKLSSYRIDFWLRMVFAAVAKILIAYYLWDAVFTDTGAKVIGGYSLQGMVLYFVAASLLSNLVFGSIDRFASEIYNGTLTRYLLYPVSFYVYKVVAAYAYAILCVLQVFLGLFVVWLFIGIPADVSISTSSVFTSIFVCLGSFYLYMIFQSIVELVAFWTDNVWSLSVALYFIANFLGGGLIPLSIFPEWARTLLGYSPFPFFISFPVNILIGKVTQGELIQGVLLMACWSFLLTGLAAIIWKRGLRHYSSVGI